MAFIDKDTKTQDGFKFAKADWRGGIQLAARIVQSEGSEGQYYLINACDIDWGGATFKNVGENGTEITSTGKLLSILDDQFAKITGATGDLGDQVAQITANKNAIELLNNDENTEGSVAYKIVQALASYAQKSEVRIYEADENSYISIVENGTDEITGHAKYKISVSEALKTKLSTLETDVTTLQSKVGTLETNLGTVQGDVTTLQGKVGTLETDVDTLKTDVGTLKTNVDKIKLTQQETADDGYASTYVFTNAAGTETKINIPKDQFLKSATYVTTKPVDAEGNSESVEFPALRFEWQLNTGDSAKAITYVGVKDLVNEYGVAEGENILKIANNKFSIDLDALKSAVLGTESDPISVLGKIKAAKDAADAAQSAAEAAQSTANEAKAATETNAAAIATNTTNITKAQSTADEAKTAASNAQTAADAAKAVADANTEKITANTEAIATNTTAIADNKTAIEKNAADIATNAGKIEANTSAIEANTAKIGTESIPGTITEGVTLYDASGNPVTAEQIVIDGVYYKDAEHTQQAVKGVDYTEPTNATGIYNYIDNSIKTVELTWQELS